MENPMSERNRAESRQPVETLTTSMKQKRVTQVTRNKTNYTRILSKLRVNRVKKSVRVNMIASQTLKKTTPEAQLHQIKSISQQVIKMSLTRTYWGN